MWRTAASSLFGLAPDGVCRAEQVTLLAGGLLPHRFTLTLASLATDDGGLLSVALSLISRSVGVTDHPVLRSPDFPLAFCKASGHLINSPASLCVVRSGKSKHQVILSCRERVLVVS